MRTDANTGKEIDELNHIRQSIRDILTTPIGSRVMNRDYGSRCLALVDQPLTDATLLDFYAEVSRALERWEPRFRVNTVRIRKIDNGQADLDLTGTLRLSGFSSELKGIRL